MQNKRDFGNVNDYEGGDFAVSIWNRILCKPHLTMEERKIMTSGWQAICQHQLYMSCLMSRLELYVFFLLA